MIASPQPLELPSEFHAKMAFPGEASITCERLKRQILELARNLQHSEAVRKKLADEVRRLRLLLESRAVPEYINESCVLFRRRRDGSFEDLPFCPSCRDLLEVLPAGALVCDRCVFYAPINACQLPSILDRLHRLESRMSPEGDNILV